jgi:hypothetical protein
VELWAKVSQRDRLVVFGAVAIIVGYLIGQVMASVNACAGLDISGLVCPSVNFFTWGNAGLFAILAVLAGIAAGVIVYLKIAPNMNITWPMPVSQILLGVCGLALILGALTVLMQISNGLSDAPIGMWIADVVLVGGGAVATWGAYQEWLASK